MNNYKLLRSLVHQDLLYTEVPSEFSDFKDWLNSGKFIVRNFPSKTSVEIEVNNEYAYNHMIAYDSCRMSTASFESMLSIHSVESLPKSIGWIAIQSYYAAFFSAHSIMRCFGFACSQLTKNHVMKLNSFGRAIGLSNEAKPESGYFRGYYNSSSRVLNLKKMKNTHEDTWRTLVDCLNEVSNKVLSVAGLNAHKQELSAGLTDLVNKLTNQGDLSCGGYLSRFRNSVNYRQEHDFWHPYGKKSIRSDKILSLLSSWKHEGYVPPPTWKESRESYNFFLACRDVVNLNYLLINLIVENSSEINLYKRWPGKFLNQYATT